MRFPAPAAATLLACTGLCVSLGACATPDEGYPSLAVRDGERVTGSIAAPEPQPLPAPPAATLDAIDSLLAQARQAHADFQRVANRVRPATGSGDRATRDIAIGEMMSARSATIVPLAEFDRIYAAAAAEGQDVTAIGEARAQVEALVAMEDAAIDAAIR